MIKAIMSLCLGLWLVAGVAGDARATSVPLVVPAHLSGSAVIPAAAEAPIPGLNEISHMEPPHLLFLGGGILAGLLFISPSLGIGELFSVALGVIGSEFLYQTVYKAAERSSRWF